MIRPTILNPTDYCVRQAMMRSFHCFSTFEIIEKDLKEESMNRCHPPSADVQPVIDRIVFRDHRSLSVWSRMSDWWIAASGRSVEVSVLCAPEQPFACLEQSKRLVRSERKTWTIVGAHLEDDHFDDHISFPCSSNTGMSNTDISIFTDIDTAFTMP